MTSSDHPANIKVGSNIRKFRRGKGCTISAVATAVGMSLEHLEAIEDGEVAVTVPELVAIAGAIDVGVFQLVDGL